MSLMADEECAALRRKRHDNPDLGRNEGKHASASTFPKHPADATKTGAVKWRRVLWADDYRNRGTLVTAGGYFYK